MILCKIISKCCCFTTLFLARREKRSLQNNAEYCGRQISTLLKYCNITGSSNPNENRGLINLNNMDSQFVVYCSLDICEIRISTDYCVSFDVGRLRQGKPVPSR